MIEFRDWIRSHGLPDKPWLVLGKGPTFEARDSTDLASYNLLSLNHAVRALPVDVAHIIDIDVAEQCQEVLADHARFVLMPRHPHVASKASLLTLQSFLGHLPVLQELDRQGRLVCYDAATSDDRGVGPRINVVFFSSEAALDLLGHLGAKTVRSLGIDGGRAYAASFKDLNGSSLLANGRSSFSLQARRLREIAASHQLDYQPLVDPLRIFIGVDDSQLLAAVVLEHTIHRLATVPVEIHPMFGLDTPMPKADRNKPRTAFSFSRFHIPELAGYRGRAVYLDADMQVFADVKELAELPFADSAVLCTNQLKVPERWKNNPHFHAGRQMSVMLLDCDQLQWNIGEIVAGLDEGRYSYEQLLFEMCVVEDAQIKDGIPPVWNHLEDYQPGVTKLLHYTVVPTQPWKNDENPLRHLWEDAFRDAVADGAVDEQLVRSQVKAGHAKASLIKIFKEAATRDTSSAIASDRASASSPLMAELEATRAALAALQRRSKVLASVRRRLRRALS